MDSNNFKTNMQKFNQNVDLTNGKYVNDEILFTIQFGRLPNEVDDSVHVNFSTTSEELAQQISDEVEFKRSYFSFWIGNTKYFSNFARSVKGTNEVDYEDTKQVVDSYIEAINSISCCKPKIDNLVSLDALKSFKIHQQVEKDVQKYSPSLFECSKFIGRQIANKKNVAYSHSNLEELKETLILAADAFLRIISRDDVLLNKFCEDENLDQDEIKKDKKTYIYRIFLNNLSVCLNKDQYSVLDEINEFLES